MSFRFNPTTGKLDLVGVGGPGPSTNPAIITSIAGENLSALRLVYQNQDEMFLASNDQDHRPIGLTITAAVQGAPVDVQLFGEITDASFTFAANQTLFLGLAGAITSTPPSAGFSVEVGYGQGTGEIFLSIKNQIVL